MGNAKRTGKQQGIDPEVTRANTENKGSDRPLKEASMDTTTLIFVIIGAFTVSSWFMRLVDYLEGGNKHV